MLKLTNITKDYPVASGAVHALRGVTIGFRKQDFVSILGPSGCGKTTLLNIIGGLDHYTDGDLAINGISTKQYSDRDWDVYRNHRIGFIFQSYNLIPHQTILGNVELALTIAGIDKEERIERAKRALDRVGLEGQYYKKPNQLSGGQCQRVAIARALVNDPEILLADEPTGALDTVTSVQIMELIKEISAERLVIMVTHNPELAEQYSTRIIRLLDGEVVEDTRPMTEDEERAEEAARLAEAQAEKDAFEALSEAERKAETRRRRRRREKARMSFFTAFSLSLKNLISKKKRTTMVGIAGSIGILGIALVLAFSSGINGYITSMQDDMLSGNPITIKQSAYDLEAISGMMETNSEDNKKSPEGQVLVNSIIKYLLTTQKAAGEIMIENELTPEYMQYVANMDKSNYSSMILSYGIDLSPNLFTEFKTDNGSDGDILSVSRITSTYTALLGQYDAYSSMASMIPTFLPYIRQMPSNLDYVKSQYDLLDGDYPAGKNDILLVLDSNDKLTDMLLARFGFYSQDEFSDLIWKAEADLKNEEFTGTSYKEYFDYSDLVGKTFWYYPTDDIISLTDVGGGIKNAEYLSDAKDISADAQPIELRVCGIVSPGENIRYGSMTSGIYYTEELTDHILEANKSSVALEYISNNIYQFVKDGAILLGFGFEYENDDYELDLQMRLGEYYVIINDTEFPLEKVSEGVYTFEDGKDDSLRILTVTFNSEAKEIIVNLDRSASGHISTLTYGYEIGADGHPILALDKDGKTTQSVALTEKDSFHYCYTAIYSGMDTSDTIKAMIGNLDTGKAFTKMKDKFIRMFGGVSVPNSATIYPISFEDMHLVTDYLDAWNESDDIITVEGDFIDGVKELTRSERTQVTYGNPIETIISIIKTMIDIVTAALIAFLSISLVVSTVMIGIITYVSVVERIKEIGVIRALGGRKRDVSNLFIAETGIIGLLAGLIGVVVTYIISLIVNLSLMEFLGFFGIAALPIGAAAILVLLSVGLTLLSGVFPARSAAKKDPVVALRTE